MAAKIIKTLNVKKILPNLKSADQLMAVAPPGREAQVKELKKKVGVPGAYKIAWSQENKDK